MLRGAIPIVLVVLTVMGVVTGLVILGNIGRQRLHDHPRFTLHFADLDCPSPPGLSRPEFLDEVRYLSSLPEKLGVLDEQLPGQLRAAFAAHPWVRRVEEVSIAEHRGLVRLTFRQPVLAVRWNNGVRAVDSDGVLLPRSAPTQDLPLFQGKVEPPQGPAGSRWGDPRLEQHARELARK